MGFRTTGVRLIANVRDFRRNMGSAAGSVRDLTDKLNDARKTSKQMSESMKQASQTAASENDHMRRTAKLLDSQIASTQQSLRRLTDQMVRSGNSKRLTEQFQTYEKELKRLRDIRKYLPESDAALKGGADLGRYVHIGFMRVSPALIKSAGSILGGMTLAMLPPLSAAIGAAIVGGVGVGGVIGGVTLAAQDPRVKAAAVDLGHTIMMRLENAAQPFVIETLRAISEINTMMGRINFGKLFGEAAGLLRPLLMSMMPGFESFMDSVEKTMASARPAVAALGSSAGYLLQTMGEIFMLFADNGPALVTGLSQIVTMFAAVAKGVAQLVNGFTEIYGGLAKLGLYGREAQLTMLAVEGQTRNTAVAYDELNDRMVTVTKSVDQNTGKIIWQNGWFERSKKTIDGLVVSEQTLEKVETGLKEAKADLTATQQEYQSSLDNITPRLSHYARLADSARKATEMLYGAQRAGMDANVEYEDSWDKLSQSVKENGATLDITNKKGRENFKVLKELLLANGEVYYANLALTGSTERAGEAHVVGTNKIIKHAEALGFDKRQTQRLVAAYGQIPPQKVTDLIVTGLSEIRDAMTRVYIAQRALAEGKPINAVRYEGTAAMRSLTFADGGYTGDGHKYKPAGIVHAGEYVIRKESTARLEANNPGLLEELNATGQTPAGYAGGGKVLFPTETRKRIPMRTTLANTFVMSMKDALAKVAPQFGAWPGSPGAQRGDSGVWRKIVQLIRSTGPMSGSFGNGYRHGDPKWHGSGRAVDWMGYNQDRLAAFLAARKPLELIHRTNQRDYAYTRGRNMGSFNRSLMEAHRNHIHIAMKNGGIIREPVMGMGASGATYSFAENGPERVLSAGQTASGMGTVTIHSPIYINGNALNPEQIANAVSRRLGQMADRYTRVGV